MIDEKKLIEELEQMPYIHGRYDHDHADLDFILGIESWHEIVMNKINEQPKVGEWIPCSERLPEEPLFEKVYIVQSEYIKEPFSAYWDGENWTDVYDEEIEVIAWQPLPKPFQKG